MTLDRRSFLRLSALGAAAGAVAPLSLGAGPVVRRPPSARRLPLDFRPIRRGVGIFTERGGTIGWLVNDGGIAAVDSQYPETARAFLDGLPGRDGRTLDLLLNSHHHGDHTAGNATFRPETGRIVAHRRARELHRSVGGPEVEDALADRTFDDAFEVEVGDERIRARHYGPAHTGGDAVIHFERADVVHMGDLVFNRAYPFIDRPGGASVRGWARLLRTVVAEHGGDTRFIFGHSGPEFDVTGGREDVSVQADFLEALLEQAEAAIRAGRSRDEVLETDAIPGFPDHRALGGRLTAGAALAVAYDELSEGR